MQFEHIVSRLQLSSHSLCIGEKATKACHFNWCIDAKPSIRACNRTCFLVTACKHLVACFEQVGDEIQHFLKLIAC